VKIGTSISEPVKLTSGVSQGGILSPIILIIYGADMEEWVKHSCIWNYADDSKSSCKDKDEQVNMKETGRRYYKHFRIHGIKWTGGKSYKNCLCDAKQQEKMKEPKKSQWETIKFKNQYQQNFLV